MKAARTLLLNKEETLMSFQSSQQETSSRLKIACFTTE